MELHPNYQANQRFLVATSKTTSLAQRRKVKNKKSAPVISSQSMRNQSRKNEKNKAADTVSKIPNPLLNNGRITEPGISAKPAQN